MAVNVAALVGMIVFYILILVVGILSSRKRKSNMEETILADRGLGVIICTFTLTATWIGGAEINGTAEAIYTPGVGLVWTLAPWCYSLSLALGGLTVAKTLRRRRYVTMIDPYQARYGENMGVLLLLLHVTADLFFAAATLLALGTTVSVVIGLDLRLSTIVSEVVVVVYTLFGGIRSVAYTDIVQLPCILLGLCLSIPFAVKHPAVSDITNNTSSWLGEWPTEMTARWIDDSLMLIVGAVPVSIYLQRVLAARTPTVAQVSSVLACFGAIILTIPAVIIGAIGNKTDWAKTSYFIAPPLNGTNNTITPSIQPSLVLPLVIQYLTPTWVSVIGLGAVAAAVMSSCDSVLVAVSSEIAYNVYKPLFRKKASDREIVWVTRVTVVVSAIISTAIALSVGSIYWLLFLLAEVQYAVMVPQFYCAVFFKKANTYGSFIAIIVGLVLRIGGGDPILEIPVFIKYPYYSDVYGQRFPFKLLCMLSSLASLVLVSYLTRWLFLSRVLPRSADIFRCYRKSSNKEDSQITHDTKL